MKKILIILILLTAGFNLFANESDRAKRATQGLIRDRERELRNQNISQNERDYLLDCYKIDIVADTMQEFDSSTAGIIEAINYSYDEYDKLLNKYYQFYRNRLNNEEKKVLLEEQRAWLKLRDAYFEYVNAYHSHVYTVMGGGTIYSIMAANMKLEFLKNRVKELFDYYDKGLGDVY